MLTTYLNKTDNALWRNAIAILTFALLTAIGAQITVFTEPVPFTLQVLAVLLSGLALGARAGAASQIAYCLMIASGMPVAAGGLGGLAVFLRPTAGYLIGFIAGAWLTGWLAEQGMTRSAWLRWVAGIAGVVPIYLLGSLWLKISLNFSLAEAITVGVAPFIAFDLLKAVIAAILAESGHKILARWLGKH
ncbi:MAG TPA: biotin transporter BioY [Anaerolineales bacterium]|nr:biotin transporter BioY [Anaerolineales bacterium]